MTKKNDKGRLPPFVPLLLTTIDSRAWLIMSHGAKWLYVCLKRKANSGPRAYLAYSEATKLCRCGRSKVKEWFAELEHYGFIRLHSHGCLGSDGQGKAPHWRLTEKGQTSKASPNGLFEPPPNDFLKWDGTEFDERPYRAIHNRKETRTWDDEKIESWRREKQNPSTHVGTAPVPTSVPVPVPTSVPLEAETGTHVGTISEGETGTHVGTVSSLTTTGESQEGSEASPPAPLPTSSGPSLGKEDILAQYEDPKITALNATEARKRKEPSHEPD